MKYEPHHKLQLQANDKNIAYDRLKTNKPDYYRIAGYFRGIYISRISRKHSPSMKIKILKNQKRGRGHQKGVWF